MQMKKAPHETYPQHEILNAIEEMKSMTARKTASSTKMAKRRRKTSKALESENE